MVVHPHFHFRRTGTTSHVESVVSELHPMVDARALGLMLSPSVPKVTLAELWRRLGSERVVWHAHRNNELIVGLLLRALFCRFKVVFTRHAATRPTVITRWLLNQADEVVSLTAEVARGVERKSTIIGHGVDTQRFRPPPDRAAAWRALQAGEDAGIGVVGRLRPEKGQADFVEALRPLMPGHPRWRALVIGRIKPSERVWASALLSNPPERLSWRDEQADVLPWYQGLSILVQPSRSEGFSLVLLEALASGCCVVAARLPHFPELVREGETGFLYQPGDVPALRALLDRLMGDPQTVAAVGARAAEDAKQRLTLRQEAEQLAALYRPWLGSA